MTTSRRQCWAESEEPGPLRPIAPGFHVRAVQEGRVRIVAIEGELDDLTAPRLAAAVKDDDSFDALVLDLSTMPFISSAGLRVIVAVHRRLARRGGGVALVDVPSFVAHVLEVVGLADELPVAADVPTAIRLLTARA
jgi:anti-anti-sigma factor